MREPRGPLPCLCLALPLQECFWAELSCFPAGEQSPGGEETDGPAMLEPRCHGQSASVLGSPGTCSSPRAASD